MVIGAHKRNGRSGGQERRRVLEALVHYSDILERQYQGRRTTAAEVSSAVYRKLARSDQFQDSREG